MMLDLAVIVCVLALVVAVAGLLRHEARVYRRVRGVAPYVTVCRRDDPPVDRWTRELGQ